jgi:plastocyanin
MKRLMYLIPLSAIAVLLLATPGLTQTTPNDIEASPTQTTDAVQETGGAATDPTTAPTETTAPAESTAPAPNSTTTVDIRDHAFNPAQLNVAPGTTVRFVNNDTEPHTATADNGLFDTGVLQPGSSFDVFWMGRGRWHTTASCIRTCRVVSSSAKVVGQKALTRRTRQLACTLSAGFLKPILF